jgi:hypothetical protein
MNVPPLGTPWNHKRDKPQPATAPFDGYPLPILLGVLAFWVLFTLLVFWVASKPKISHTKSAPIAAFRNFLYKPAQM